MSPNSQYSCSDQPNGLSPYGDVSGPGVLIGFIGTGYITVSLILGNYFLFADPTHRIDRVFLDFVWDILSTFTGWNYLCIWLPYLTPISFRRWCGKQCTSLSLDWKGKIDWKGGIEEWLSSMSDIQMLTGLSILISGYSSLPVGISAYHWQIICYLAWFSNMAHFSAITILHESRTNVKFWRRSWRLASMFILFALLLGALVPTAFFNWENELLSAAQPASYAFCFYSYTFGTSLFNSISAQARMEPGACTIDGTELSPSDCAEHYSFTNSTAFQAMCFSMFLLSANFLIRVLKLIASTKTSAHLTVCAPNQPVSSRPHISAIQILVKFCLDLPSSMLVEIYLLVTSTVWGTDRLLSSKSSVKVDENSWTFGQILPICFLVAPIISAIRSFTREQEHLPQSRDTTGAFDRDTDTTADNIYKKIWMGPFIAVNTAGAIYLSVRTLFPVTLGASPVIMLIYGIADFIKYLLIGYISLLLGLLTENIALRSRFEGLLWLGYIFMFALFHIMITYHHLWSSSINWSWERSVPVDLLYKTHVVLAFLDVIPAVLAFLFFIFVFWVVYYVHFSWVVIARLIASGRSW
ncbi:hypothetical protein B0T25DRAFT_245300 [Lasiosphaeria hispida]|uniref:Uncharacterized protein n=1 Tax=Lasiosphaeria hispida TaxID=260671 RepID=A0AAJ0HES1_9PEZI|nr:hypothetical protein B0T25DRAFT_245300 [Lasiosphaeria hispida]